MTRNDKIRIVDEIRKYADEVLKDIDPEKTNIAFQIDKLKPKMEEIAQKYQVDVSEVFIIYMDGISQIQAEEEQRFQSKINKEEL